MRSILKTMPACTQIRRRQVDLQAVRQLCAVWPLRIARLVPVDCDSAALELGTCVLGDPTGGR